MQPDGVCGLSETMFHSHAMESASPAAVQAARPEEMDSPPLEAHVPDCTIWYEFPETVVASVESTSHASFAGAVPVALTRGRRLWRRTGIGTPRVRGPTTNMHRKVTEGKTRGRTPLAFGWTMFSGRLVVCGAHGHGREGLES